MSEDGCTGVSACGCERVPKHVWVRECGSGSREESAFV